jgi:hypothetical protein
MYGNFFIFANPQVPFDVNFLFNTMKLEFTCPDLYIVHFALEQTDNNSDKMPE